MSVDEEKDMMDYELMGARVACGVAALAMSTLTIGALVVLPARVESESRIETVLAASRHAIGPCAAALPESGQSASN
jgi:hypothetical protein